MVAADEERQLLALGLREAPEDRRVEVVHAARHRSARDLARRGRAVGARVDHDGAGAGAREDAICTEQHLSRREIVCDDRQHERRAARSVGRARGESRTKLGEPARLRRVAVPNAQREASAVQVHGHPRAHRAESNECDLSHLTLHSRDAASYDRRAG